MIHDTTCRYRRKIESKIRAQRIEEAVSSSSLPLIPLTVDITDREMVEPSTSSADFIIDDSINRDDSLNINLENSFHENVNNVANHDDSINNDLENSIISNTSGNSENEDLSDSFEVNNFENFKVRLKNSFLNANMTHVQVNTMLGVLRTHSCFSSLPKDARKMLSTPRSPCDIQILENDNELYLHLGLESAIYNILEETSNNLIPDILEIDFSTDGASLDKTGKIQLWPIQIRVANIHNSKPEIVGVYQGAHKPSNAHTFIRPFINDVHSMLADGGILFDKKRIPIIIRCFIADAPARASLLGHAAHNSSFPCSKCTVGGNCIRRGVMVYSGNNHTLRTAERYKNRIDGDHHTEGESLLYDLNLDLVSQVPFEYMHLVCLGVMAKILTAVIDGKYSVNAKLSPLSIKYLNSRLKLISEFCPTDFARKPASFEKHRKFKATELRQILLYSGPVIFSGLMDQVVYLHFMFLHNSMRILASTEIIEDQFSYAEEALKKFVIRAETVYGKEFLTYNVHGLLHVVNDVKLFGSLDSYSAFSYENNIRFLLKTCRKPSQFLQQISKRREESKQRSKSRFIENQVKVFSPHSHGPLTTSIESLSESSYQQWRKIKYNDTFLAINNRDDIVFLNDSRICLIRNIVTINKKHHFIVSNFLEVGDFSNIGIESSTIGVFRCSHLSEQMDLIDLGKINFKCFRMPYWDPDRPQNNDKPIPDEYIVIKLLKEKMEN